MGPNDKVVENCILETASRIAQGKPVSHSQARDFCHAVSYYFTNRRDQERDQKSREIFEAVSTATQGIVDEYGLAPGFSPKYRPGMSDEQRKREVRIAYRNHGEALDEKIDPIWE